jgi:hypothetical protein
MDLWAICAGQDNEQRPQAATIRFQLEPAFLCLSFGNIQYVAFQAKPRTGEPFQLHVSMYGTISLYRIEVTTE